MVVCGVIAEYDPFHLGHSYQLTKARELSGADYIVVVLGAPFSQRGAPAMFSQQSRAETALRCGADAVFSLPVSFAAADAERFTLGGVAVLDALHCVTHLCFGAECGDISALSAVAGCLADESPDYKKLLKRYLAEGSSHAAAQGRALKDMLSLPSDMLSSPNNVLAVCYLRALRKLASGIKPLVVKRLGAYHGMGGEGFASASAIRGALLRGDMGFAAAAMPEASFEAIRQACESGAVSLPGALSQAFMYRLMMMTPSQLRALPGMAEGLENRFLDNLTKTSDASELLDLVKTKRYTYSRLSRILTSALLMQTKEALAPLPEYTRLLGFNTRALPLLSRLKGARIKVISKNAAAKPLLCQEERAEALWALSAHQASTFYRQSPIIFEP